VGVSVARVSQIERGDVSTQDVLNLFIAALGGTLKLIAECVLVRRLAHMPWSVVFADVA
jgi:hypothetical protein